MKYCTFQYSVRYHNGQTKQGTAPYRGQDIDAASLRDFVVSYFAGTSGQYDDITVQVLTEYQNEEKWINAIIDLKDFRHLQQLNGYAGELIQKYFASK
ncbi:hypothetical protein KTO58_13810 [Chitinophaga pendula]|uniref:hypothetical protein n=1 Tax=Chitinophaga TaxID=79328 RepID=UPI000BB0B7C3|nr:MULTISPECIES: hypothetical protein [Chitinophaga]ASZ12192.1 hypothetical protein CK934_15100 [Chitinophaga sp. MD30]UCJ04781.1 hypothetical protein KTO58_13810 [Chitinophaga pendula]